MPVNYGDDQAVAKVSADFCIASDAYIGCITNHELSKTRPDQVQRQENEMKKPISLREEQPHNVHRADIPPANGFTLVVDGHYKTEVWRILCDCSRKTAVRLITSVNITAAARHGPNFGEPNSEGKDVANCKFSINVPMKSVAFLGPAKESGPAPCGAFMSSRCSSTRYSSGMHSRDAGFAVRSLSILNGRRICRS